MWCGWGKIKECGKVLYEKRFLVKAKQVVHKRYVRALILFGSEAWCRKDSEMGIV